tara:strand:- start:1072 stop:1530 length:459 start_codon:yes stop_codon:yes gene_type:complete
MKYLLTIFLFLTFNSSFAANKVKEKPFYGTDFESANALPILDIVANFDQYKSKDIVLKAQAEKVCAQKGCWMTMKLEDKSVRIKFKDYGFFVPLSLAGKDIFIKGQMTKKKVSIKDTRHYLEDAGASKEEIAAVTKPSDEYHFEASGVKLAN